MLRGRKKYLFQFLTQYLSAYVTYLSFRVKIFFLNIQSIFPGTEFFCATVRKVDLEKLLQELSSSPSPIFSLLLLLYRWKWCHMQWSTIWYPLPSNQWKSMRTKLFTNFQEFHQAVEPSRAEVRKVQRQNSYQFQAYKQLLLKRDHLSSAYISLNEYHLFFICWVRDHFVTK